MLVSEFVRMLVSEFVCLCCESACVHEMCGFVFVL